MKSFAQSFLNLVILDIDGTLTDTNQVDAECYTRALEECFSLTGIETDWSAYKNATDLGILLEIFQRRFERSPSGAEIAHMRESFVGYLQGALAASETAFSPVPGAGRFLSSLGKDHGWAGVVATGGWGVSARLKLQAADLAIKCPVVSCDAGISREEILQQAMAEARHFYEVAGFSRLVSVGDGAWDVKTARYLHLPFVGIAQGARAERLWSLGASHVLPNFLDLDEVFAALDQARQP